MPALHLQDDQHATVHHEVNICTKDIHQLDGLLYDYVLRNIEDGSILCKSRIESCYAILGGISQLAVVLFTSSGCSAATSLRLPKMTPSGK